MNTIPQELNWVEKRAACNVAQVFNQLCEGVISDVSAINVASGLDSTACFSANLLTGGTTIVVGQASRLPRIVTRIGVVDNQIVVARHPSNESDWAVTVGLNNEGRCILRLDDGTELEQWQFRKKALESLFFGDKP
jgi:hypothetical protein